MPIGTKTATDTSAVTVPRNRIPISTCVNFEKFRGYAAGVKVAGIEDKKKGGEYRGEVVPMEHIVGLSKDVCVFL